jgi:hypothetical protein
LTVKRRLSFDKNARLVKGATDEDQRLFGPESPGGGTAILEGARNSVNLAKRALIPRILSPNPLAAKGVGARSKSGDALRKNPNGLSHMLVPSLPLSPCFEVGPLVVRFQADQAAWRFLGTSAPFPDESVSSNATTGVAAIAKKRFAPFPESLTYEDAARRHLAAVPYPSLVPEDYRVKKQGPLQRNDSNSRGASKGLGAVDAHLGSSKETEVGEEGNAAASTSKREQQQQQVLLVFVVGIYFTFSAASANQMSNCRCDASCESTDSEKSKPRTPVSVASAATTTDLLKWCEVIQ